MPETNPSLDKMTPEFAAMLLSPKRVGLSALRPTKPAKIESAPEPFFGGAVDLSEPPSRKSRREWQPLQLQGYEGLPVSHWFERCDLPEEHFAWRVEIPGGTLRHFPHRMVLSYAMSVTALDKCWPFQLTVKATLVANATERLRQDLRLATIGERPAAATGTIFLSKDGSVESEWIKF